jgi:enterochelin esterase-like enzyme
MDPVERTVRVLYPPNGALVRLRTEDDWQRDVEPVAVEQDGACHVFRLLLTKPSLYLKPVLRRGDDVRWAVGPNVLIVAALEHVARDLHPYFDSPMSCSETVLHDVEGHEGGRRHACRVYLPPGYGENTLHRYPVAYMQDGQNLFFPQEAAFGQTWRVRETLERLTAMNQTSEMIIVGIEPEDRMEDYTRPGYEAYGRFVVDVLKPRVDAQLRTRPDAASTAVIGSSLGGVVSFYMAWQHPQVFGMAACLSSTFGYKDDLRERVAEEPRRDLRLYLDSGFPRDNFEVTKQMAASLLDRGFQFGHDLLYLAFPDAQHKETAWATRLHIPFQFLFGAAHAIQGLRAPPAHPLPPEPSVPPEPPPTRGASPAKAGRKRRSA